MELNRYSDRIYYLPEEERTDRPVLGYIKGDKYSLAVDAGNSSEHVEIFYKELRKLGLSLPDFTAITHWHWDHTFGMHSASGKTIAGVKTNRKLTEVQNWKWTDESMKRRLQSGKDIELCDQYIRLEYPDRKKIKVVTAEIEFNDAIDIDLGGVHCKIMEFNASHSDDSVLILVPEERVAFIGDADCGDYYQLDGAYDKSKLREMVKVLEKIDVDIFVPGHDVPQSKLEVIGYLKDEMNR